MREYLGRTSLPKLLLGGAFAIAAVIAASSPSSARIPCNPPYHWVQVGPGIWKCSTGNNYWEYGAARQRGHRNKAGVKAPVDKSMVLDR
jgi:hypothetical protein